MQLPLRAFRSKYKPAGLPRVDWSAAPRGLLFAQPFTSPDWPELARGAPIAAQSGIVPAVTASGYGASVAGGAQYISRAYGAQPPSQWSMEALIWLNSAGAGSICSWNQGSDGTNATFDRGLFVNNSFGFVGYIYDGAPKSVTGGTPVIGLNHLVLTEDGANLRLYVNGALVGTTGTSNGGYTAYTLPVYFVTGRITSSGNVAGVGVNTPINGTYLLVNFASVCWAAAEVADRYADPFGFLIFPEDDIFATLVGAGTAPTSHIVYRRTLSSLGTRVGSRQAA